MSRHLYEGQGMLEWRSLSMAMMPISLHQSRRWISSCCTCLVSSWPGTETG